MNKNLCKALSNPLRAKLLVCLSKPKTVSELMGDCELSQSALSQHLKVLKEARAVMTKKAGKYIFYQAADKRIIKIAKLLLSYK